MNHMDKSKILCYVTYLHKFLKVFCGISIIVANKLLIHVIVIQLF